MWRGSSKADRIAVTIVIIIIAAVVHSTKQIRDGGSQTPVFLALSFR